MPTRKLHSVLVLALGVVTLLLTGCFSSAPTREAAPGAAVTSQQVQLFYATDRAISDSPDGYFGPKRGELTFGIAHVGIPPNHVIGSSDQPSMFRFEWSPDERKHIAVKDTTPVTRDEFAAQLRDAVARSRDGRVMVFTHGYNTSFEEAARLGAQFATDLKFPGPVLLFSWPSQASLTGYTVDETNAEWAQPHLAQVLNLVLDQTLARQVYLVAHSMGARINVRALTTLATDRRARVGHIIHELVLVAPDIDADLFRQDLAPRLISTGTHVTIYASSADRALVASKAFHGYPRVGESGDDLVIVPGVETVDASVASGGLLGHSYFAEDRRIMEDIFGLIQTGQTADNRFGLAPVDTPAGRYWTFRQ